MSIIAKEAERIFINFIKYKDLKKPENLLQLISALSGIQYTHRWQRERFYDELYSLIEGDSND